jgi:hypothetical protein
MTTIALALILCTPSQVELAGVAVTPHNRTPGMTTRRGEPPAPEGALVRLFLRNTSAGPIRLREAHFDRQSPLSLVPAGDWAWADVPSDHNGEALTLPPGALCVWTYNGLGPRWTPSRSYRLTIDRDGPPIECAVRPPGPRATLSAVTFLASDGGVQPDRVVAHVANRSGAPLAIGSVRLHLPVDPANRRVLTSAGPLQVVSRFPADGVVPPGETGIVIARAAQPLPLAHAAIEVLLDEAAAEPSTLWAHLRIKPEAFDISGGWVDGEAADGARLLSKEPFLRTLSRLHLNTAHIGEVPGYNDQAGPGSLFARYPLRAFNALMPLEAWDTDARLPWIHAAEYLGEPQLAGWGRVAMHPQEVFTRLQRYAPTRIASTVTLSDPSGWERYAGLSDYPHFDAYRVSCPAPDNFRAYDRWGPDHRIGWGAPLETIGDMTRSLRDLSGPAPIAVWSQGPHAGWDVYDGRPRTSPTPDELRLQAYHALAARITSLYWFNLSLRSLVKFPDTIEPLTRVGREIRMLDEFYITGSAYRHERLLRDGRPDWDLSSIIAPRGALLFALDLDYAPDPIEKVFRFGEPRDVSLAFDLPTFLREVRQVLRVDADGLTPVPFERTATGLRLTDRNSRVGVYLATPDDALPAEIERKRQALATAEQATGLDPARVEADLQTLRALLPERDR